LLASVVIRAKNEARFFGDTLEAIFQQEVAGAFEVILVDSGSTDATLDIARRFPVKVIEIPSALFTYGRALNIGIAEAQGDFIASLSAHSTPIDANWLANLIEPFKNPLVAGVLGRQVPRDNATLPELIGMRLTGVMSDRPALRDRRPLFSNANSGFRRALWQRVPFDETVAGAEDIAWARAMQTLGFLIAYEPGAAVYHSHGEPLLKHLRRSLHDAPTVLGNVLGFGSGRDREERPSSQIVPEK
jgi:glycosyltransferase involved in cell wall biosynthesis